MESDEAPRSKHLPPGYDEEDPYENKDIDSYPNWWVKNVKMFRDHEMRPYRPPKFKDGVIVQTVIEKLENELESTIQLRTINPTPGGEWEIYMDEKIVATIERERTSEGRSEYKMSSEEFKDVIREFVN